MESRREFLKKAALLSGNAAMIEYASSGHSKSIPVQGRRIAAESGSMEKTWKAASGKRLLDWVTVPR